MKKRISWLVLVLFMLSLVVTGCGGAKDAAPEKDAPTASEKKEPSKTYEIKIATWFDPSHPMVKSLEKFQEIVESKTEGNIKVKIFPSSQLGSEDTYIDSIKAGTVEMGVTGTMINTYAPLIAVAEKPYLFESWEHAEKAYFEEKVGDIMAEGIIDKAGFRVLGWAVNGWRMLSSSKKIESFEDLKGLRLRVPNVPYYIKMAEAWGCNPTPMSFSELFTALEQKVVDGQDNPYATVRASSFYEVQPYMVHTGHLFTPCPWILNEKFYQSLPEDYQKIVTEAAEEAIKYNWEISKANEDADIQFLKEQGVEIVIPDAEFKAKLMDSQKVNDQWWFDKYPGAEELCKKIDSLK
ncbi:MAG: TRAP-type transport system periplasmic protein [Clostridia bacterium]|jgi:tripartite ATP-independent transporter DctP family solute receptor|nr:TRAP-type transport system periplasmic protein [Clostridia bacterium]MDN5323136.1 TRAP-type transport system periplasmic protein [Clostridia bacterium]